VKPEEQKNLSPAAVSSPSTSGTLGELAAPNSSRVGDTMSAVSGLMMKFQRGITALAPHFPAAKIVGACGLLLGAPKVAVGAEPMKKAPNQAFPHTAVVGDPRGVYYTQQGCAPMWMSYQDFNSMLRGHPPQAWNIGVYYAAPQPAPQPVHQPVPQNTAAQQQGVPFPNGFWPEVGKAFRGVGPGLGRALRHTVHDAATMLAEGTAPKAPEQARQHNANQSPTSRPKEKVFKVKKPQ
jgi:hypothetical protein